MEGGICEKNRPHYDVQNNLHCAVYCTAQLSVGKKKV